MQCLVQQITLPPEQRAHIDALVHRLLENGANTIWGIFSLQINPVKK